MAMHDTHSPYGAVVYESGVAKRDDVATVAALKALAATHPAHVGGNVVTVLADGSRWSYHPTSSLTGDDLFVVTPTNASGRWLRKVGSVDLKLPIGHATADGATLLTMPAGARMIVRRCYWEVTTAFTGGSSTTWTAVLIANASAAKWILAQARGDGELSILSHAGFVAAASGAFALAGNDRLRILVRDGLVTVYVGDGTRWVRHYHSDIGGSLPGTTSGDFARVGLRLSEGSGAAGTVTAQWADVIVRGL